MNKTYLNMKMWGRESLGTYYLFSCSQLGVFCSIVEAKKKVKGNKNFPKLIMVLNYKYIIIINIILRTAARATSMHWATTIIRRCTGRLTIITSSRPYIHPVQPCLVSSPFYCSVNWGPGRLSNWHMLSELVSEGAWGWTLLGWPQLTILRVISETLVLNQGAFFVLTFSLIISFSDLDFLANSFGEHIN